MSVLQALMALPMWMTLTCTPCSWRRRQAARLKDECHDTARMKPTRHTRGQCCKHRGGMEWSSCDKLKHEFVRQYLQQHPTTTTQMSRQCWYPVACMYMITEAVEACKLQSACTYPIYVYICIIRYFRISISTEIAKASPRFAWLGKIAKTLFTPVFLNAF